MVKYGGLLCVDCGSNLELSVGYDGIDEEAIKHHKDNNDFGCLVSLECTKCSRVYPVCRCADFNSVSAINN